MTARNLVTARVYGKTIQVDYAEPDDTEAGIVVLLSGLGIAGEDAARFAQSAADVIDGFQYELCAECMGDVGEHDISPDMFGLAHAWCLKCPECGGTFPRLSSLTAHMKGRVESCP